MQPRLNRGHTVVVGDAVEAGRGHHGDGGADRTLTLVKMAAALTSPTIPTITVGQVVYFPSFELGG
jgi:hypothetical protein